MVSTLDLLCGDFQQDQLWPATLTSGCTVQGKAMRMKMRRIYSEEMMDNDSEEDRGWDGERIERETDDESEDLEESEDEDESEDRGLSVNDMGTFYPKLVRKMMACYPDKALDMATSGSLGGLVYSC
eukprot:2421268-Rhodomonas_salina.2